MSHELVAKEERRVFERFVPVEQAFVMDQKSFGIIKNISLGGVAMYCVNDSRLGQSSALDIFLASSTFSLLSGQYAFVASRSTPGQAITINHICFNNLSSSQLGTLWQQIRSSCVSAEKGNLHKEDYCKYVSFLRHDYSSNRRAFQKNNLIHLSQNNDKTPLFVPSTLQ